MPNLVALFWYSGKFPHSRLIEEWRQLIAKAVQMLAIMIMSIIMIITAVIIVFYIVSKEADKHPKPQVPHP